MRLRERIQGFLGHIEETYSPVEFAPAVPVREVFRRFWPYARPYRRWLALLLLFVALAPAVDAATLYLFKLLVDDVLVARDLGPLVWIALAYVGLTALGGIVSFCDDYLGDWVGESFLLSLRRGFFEHLHGLSLDFFERRKLGDVISRLSGDIAAIESLVLSGVTQALAAVAQLVIFVGVLFYLSWKLALISLFVVPLFYAAARYFSRRIKHASREHRRRSGATGAVAEESLSNAALVQAYNRQAEEAARFHREALANFRAKMAATRLKALFSPLIDLIELSGVLVVIGVGALLLARGELTLGGLLVFIAFLSQLYDPVRELSGLINTVYAAAASAERIIEFLDERPSVEDRPGARSIARASGRVEFEAVSFSYPAGRGAALEDISFRVEPGETLALVGPSGAGKSTIVKLLLRFYDPDAGAVRLDGTDIRDIRLRSLRENVAVLLQETLVFDGTVRENIAYGRPGATDEEVARAARLADAHEFIARLPDGYETVVGQKGRRLSGGQRQRIAIARAMIRDAPVLVLDEPTSGLDAESGRRVLEPLRRLMRGRTTIIISHDLSTVREADRILVLDRGRVAESGTHGELMRGAGLYADLYRAPGSEVLT
ncbi:ABC transporter ATP-binding protein [Rubrobacter taiwanensis]|uniref:ABC transporter ATP-binding protein n=1 Tax=Rubrobacter taiwanensis TaxID=185139 RepID=A0A4R1BLR6_9ACTN|nr:ABC transporter ATP-binding protein [Rubrobacter taiwanensis]TCJ18381.1 ABC transporter ATP-binding protein [Rubrobacter taiwanensis]